MSIDKHDIDHRTRHSGKSAEISWDTLFIIWNCVWLSTLTEKQINQDPPVAKENVLLMEIEMKRNSQKPDTVGPTVLSKRVKKKIIVILCVWGRISRSLAYNHALLVIFTKMIILSPSSSFSSLSTPSSTKSFSSSKIALREDDSYLNCAHSQISREGGLRGYYHRQVI